MFRFRQAFTLIELLVVIAIIALLAGIILAIVGSINVRGQIASTQALLDTLAGGISRYKDEAGHYPLPNGSPTTPFIHPEPSDAWDFPDAYERFSWYPTSDVGGWERQALAWRLCTTMSDVQRKQAKADVQAFWQEVDYIAGAKDLQKLWVSMSLYSSIGSTAAAELRPEIDARVTDAEAEEIRASTTDWTKDGKSISNSGTIAFRGWAKIEICRLRGLRARSFFSRTASTFDVLDLTDLPQRFRRDDCIVDLWEQPIGYVFHHEPGHESRRITSNNNLRVNERHLPAHHRLSLTDRNGDGIVNEDDYGIAPSDPVDCNGDGSIDESDWGSHLWYALPGYEAGFIVFSAGPDRQTHRRYLDPMNDDDIRYRGGLK